MLEKLQHKLSKKSKSLSEVKDILKMSEKTKNDLLEVNESLKHELKEIKSEHSTLREGCNNKS